MRRSGPIRRLTPLRARLPIRRVSDTRRARSGRETAILAGIRRRDGDRCRLSSPRCWGPVDVHHVLPRGRGGTTTADNLVCLCRACHSFVHEHPAWARDLGWLR